MPGIITESIVIRFLDASESIDDFEQIGFSETSLKILEHQLQKRMELLLSPDQQDLVKQLPFMQSLKNLMMEQKNHHS